jgi:tetratricopeptide (TPR) repeat protein
VAYVRGAALRRAVGGASYLSQSSVVLHFGLGDATAIDRLVVRWRGGATSTYTGLTAGQRWQIVEGASAPTAVEGSGQDRQPVASRSAPAANPLSDRDRQIAFWDKYRAAMHALKVEQNCTKAIPLFREALTYEASHEDGRYYLGHCLAAGGDVDGALALYEQMTHDNPQSHRGFARWGALRAITARSAIDLQHAEQALAKAYGLNPEETGALLSLGEVALMRGERARAQQRLAAVCQTNPRATGGFFLLGYVKWKQGSAAAAAELLRQARASLGPEWKPKGATAEGDVLRKAHTETSPLSRFWESWDGGLVPARAYAELDGFLKTVAR